MIKIRGKGYGLWDTDKSKVLEALKERGTIKKKFFSPLKHPRS
jgi:hypothetical protein